MNIFSAVLRFPFAVFVLLKNIVLSLFINKKGVYSQIISDLDQEGYAIIGEKYGDTNFEKISESIKFIVASHKLPTSGQSNGRVLNLHLDAKDIANYCDFLKKIAEEYFDDKNINVEMSLFQKSVVEKNLSDVPGGEGFHMDDSKKIIKFFLYLTDVNLSNGPFCYIPKTHGLLHLNKFFRFLKWNIFKKNEYLYLSDEDELINNHSIQRMVYPKGTVFCADTTGFHKALPLTSGIREVFVVSFSEKRGGLPTKAKKYLAKV